MKSLIVILSFFWSLSASRMAILTRVSLILIASLYLAGCAAALVGGAFYKTSKTREQKQKFMTNYNQTNLEREKAGLPKLDLCTEKYQFDEKWAKEDPECKKRIEAYEAGDKSALGASEMDKAKDVKQE